MAEKVKVMVVDDIAATRENICKLMEFHPEMTVVGQAGTAEEAIHRAAELQPDIILMDINMPGMDGITATEIIATDMPNASIIIMSVQGEQEYLRRAMVAGAKNYLIKPFTGDELLTAVSQVYSNEQKRAKNSVKLDKKAEPEQGKIITVFSSKGGIGKTTIGTNLAVAMGNKLRADIGVIDADLQFGDVALFLNLLPRVTIADLVRDIDNLDEKLLDSYLTEFNDKIKVLAAPLRPEQAETITGAHIGAILKVMRRKFRYTIIDTAPAFNDIMLTILDQSDAVIVVASMDLPTIKNAKLCLEIMESLGYSDEKIKLVLNRSNTEAGMDMKEVEDSLKYSFSAAVPSDGKTVVSSVNKGIPFIISNPETPVAQSIFALMRTIVNDDWRPIEEPKESMVFKLKRLFG